MADENPNPDPNPAPVAPPVADPPANDPPAERSVPYARFQEVNGKLRALETQIAELTTKAGSADELNAKLASVSADLARNRVAMAKGVPAELADMLVGKDEAELNAAADRLLKFVKTKQAPDINGQTASPDKPTFTRAQISDYAFYQKNRDAIMLAQREGRISD